MTYARPMLSGEPTIELVVKAKAGDSAAVEAILERCLPRLRRWAHGRLPTLSRGALDTNDLVQETVIHVLGRLDAFDVRHVGAMQAYLRRSVINRIRDEVRKIGRRPEPVELPETLPSEEQSPLERAIQSETYDCYRSGLARLRDRDRKLVLARVDLQWTTDEIKTEFGFASIESARRATARALDRLAAVMKQTS